MDTRDPADVFAASKTMRDLLEALKTATPPPAAGKVSKHPPCTPWRYDYSYRLPFRPQGMSVIMVSQPDDLKWGDTRGVQFGNGSFVDTTYFIDGKETVFAKAITRWQTNPWKQTMAGRYTSQAIAQVTALWFLMLGEFSEVEIPSGFLSAFCGGVLAAVDTNTKRLIITRDLGEQLQPVIDLLEAQAALFLASDAANDAKNITGAFPVDTLFKPEGFTAGG